MELITFILAAGETKRWERAGRYVEVIDASGAFDLFLSDANGGRVDYAKGALSGVYLEGAYQAIELSSASAQSITLLVTDGRGGSRRQPGIVQVVDVNKSRTIAGSAFALASARASSAGVYARCGLVNPTGSTRRAVVERLRYGTNGATTTFAIGIVLQANLGGVGGAVASKLAGGPASTCVNQADSSGVFAQNFAQFLYQLPGTSGEIALPTPIVMPPGYGLVVNVSTANQDAFLNVDFFEEAL